ncbi:MAG: sugar phosphate isomerase/epimerase [Opitutaceae bacterium]|jgi:D-psicose/D-tagatose/L-ribulose 3-epimerase|nr:sugar phosphate isomerase/epimerase [Opitutaceae bacterium]
MNKLGIHYGAFVSTWMEEQLPLIKKAAELGFDALELGAIFLKNCDDDKIRQLRDEADKRGVELALSLGLGLSEDISSADATRREAGIDTLKKVAVAMKKARISDCSGIVYGAWNGKVSSVSERDECWQRSIASMKEVAKVFEDQGVYLNMEVVNRFESFLINDCNTALRYIEEVGSAHLGIHLDTFHMNIEEDSMISAITKAGKRLRYFHIGENNRKFPGLGSMPWREIIDTLRAVDYRNPITMEVFVTPGTEVAAAVSLYRPIHKKAATAGSSCDEDLRASVQFVRNLL